MNWRVRNRGEGVSPVEWYDLLVVSDKSSWAEARIDPKRKLPQRP